MAGKLLFAFTVVLAGSVWGQSVISAHSGVIHYVEGQVMLDGQTVAPKFAEFPDVKTGQTLGAQDGRAEVLLTPGVFLRLSENSSFRMISNKLADTRVEILAGSALVEVGELLQDNAITLQFHDAQVALLKKGLYRVDADAGRLRVYDGEARVTSGSQTIIAKHGREVQLGAVLEAHGFDTKQTDAFYRWSARRVEYIAQANIVAAKSSGYASSGTSQWAWNPWFGMFTFIPSHGIYNSPFGYAFYSPVTVEYVYAPRPTVSWNPGTNMGGYSAGNSAPLSIGSGSSSSGSSGSSAPMSVGHSAPASSGAVGSAGVGGMRGGAH